MKKIIGALAIAAITFASCNNADKKNTVADVKVASSATAMESDHMQSKNEKPMHGILTGYLQIKNGLANDNGEEAASGGKAFVEAIGKVDKTKFTDDQNNAYTNLADDAKEMAEHISENADKLEHQREHFEMLSNDVYDMVKTFGAGEQLYKDYCPMYNDNKGAIWLSETKEIKNPYLGKKMPACGTVKEELK